MSTSTRDSTVTMAQVASVGSPYSASGAITVPNPTPASIGSAPQMDFEAVARILGPMQDVLNDSAEDPIYPSPPINTPEVQSPAPSIVYRYQGRGRGISIIGDRLAQLKMGGRKVSQNETDQALGHRSAEPSVAGDESCDISCTSEVMNIGGHDGHGLEHVGMSLSAPLATSLDADSVPIALGSPTLNPRLPEYLAFPSTTAENASSTTRTLGTNSLDSHNSIKSENGVTEKSNWAEDVEERLENTCLSLEQLARDENQHDDSKSVEEYYIARLIRLLGNKKKREFPVDIQKKVAGSEE